MSLCQFVWVSPYRTEFQGYFFQPEYGKTQGQSTFEGVFWTKAAPATTSAATTEAVPATTSAATTEAVPATTLAVAIGVIAIIAIAGMIYFGRKRSKSVT